MEAVMIQIDGCAGWWEAVYRGKSIGITPALAQRLVSLGSVDAS